MSSCTPTTIGMAVQHARRRRSADVELVAHPRGEPDGHDPAERVPQRQVREAVLDQGGPERRRGPTVPSRWRSVHRSRRRPSRSHCTRHVLVRPAGPSACARAVLCAGILSTALAQDRPAILLTSAATRKGPRVTRDLPVAARSRPRRARARCSPRSTPAGWRRPGPDLAAFEAEVAAVVGRRHAVALTSGTAALHLAPARARGRARATTCSCPTSPSRRR